MSPLTGKSAEIATLALEGHNQTYIAEKFGVDQSVISRKLRSDAICKAILDNAQREIVVSCTPKIVANYLVLLDSEDESIRLKATNDAAKIIGIQPSHAQSVFINKLYIDQRQTSTPTELRDTAKLLGVSDVIVQTQLVVVKHSVA
jgi:hypothetical protein